MRTNLTVMCLTIFVYYFYFAFWIRKLNEFTCKPKTADALLHLCLWCTHGTHKCTKNPFLIRVARWLPQKPLCLKKHYSQLKYVYFFTRIIQRSRIHWTQGKCFWSLVSKFDNVFSQKVSCTAYKNSWSPAPVFKSQWRGPWRCFSSWTEIRSKMWDPVCPGSSFT